MSLPSKFEGKCRSCGSTWKAGEQIHKKSDWLNWCSNENCTQGTVQSTASSSSFGDMIQTHRTVLEMAKAEAKNYFESRKTPGSSYAPKDLDILTRVFYKKMMDYSIHKK